MFDAEAIAAKVARKGSYAYAAALDAARAASDEDEAFAAARAAVRPAARRERMSVADISVHAAEFAGKYAEIVPEVREAMLMCRARGETDPTIRAFGRATAAEAKVRVGVVEISREIAEEFTRGKRLRDVACDAIFAEAWIAHQNGRDVRQAATRAAKAWRQRQDNENRKRYEAKSIAARAARVAGEKYAPRFTIADEELARCAAYRRAHDILSHGGTKHEAYIAARRTAKSVHMS